MNRFFDEVDRVVDTYGGTIDKHIGDAVMAVFGAPTAHGNDPERAVRAAIDMHAAMHVLSRAVGVTLRVHIGIASGQVVASGLGSASHSEYTMTGASVNLASRLVELAEAEQTFISDAVYRAVADLVEAESIGDVSVRGLDAVVRVWRLNSIAQSGRRGQETPFVGRRSELRQFRGALEAIGETGAGQAICVRGDIGIGKSRLVREFGALCLTQGFACHTGLVLDFGIGKGLGAIRDVLHGLLGVSPESEQAERVAAAERSLEAGLIDPDHRIFLHDLLDLPQGSDMRAVYDAMDNDVRNRRKQECLATLVRRLSQRQPQMIAIEDLHWATPLILGYLAQLSSVTAEAPFVLMMTSRIEGDPLDQAWRQATGRAPLMTIDLAPLRRDEAMELAGGFVDATNRFAMNSIERAEGNPMFLEQLLRSATAGEEEDVPGSIQSIVLSRVDRLSEPDKQALQAATVLGQRFTREVLRFLIDDSDYACDTLVDHHLVRPTGSEFLFSHALIWESVYGSLLKERSRSLHRRAAQWYANRNPMLYAEHLDRADDPAAAGAYREAANAEARLYHFERALQLSEQGLALATAPADKFDLSMLRGDFLRELGKPAESIAEFRNAVEVAGDDVGRCRAWIGLAAGMRVTDEFDEALASLDLAQAVGDARQLDLELSQVHYYRGNLFFPLGDIEGCLEQHLLALEYGRKAGSPECEARAMSGLGDAYYSQGRMVTAADHYRRCIELCRAHGLGRIEVGNRYMIAWMLLYMNDIAGALDEALGATEAAVRAGHGRAEMVARLTVGRVLVEKGDPVAAEPHIERGLELAESLGANRFKPFLMIYLARLRHARQGPRGGAADLMRQALDISRATGVQFLGPWVLATLALVSDDPAASAAALVEGEALLAEDCVGHNYIAFYIAAMEVALRGRDWDEVDRHAQALADYSGQEPIPWCTYFIARGRALAAHGRAPGAATAGELDRLKQAAQSVGMTNPVAAIDQALAAG